MICGWESCTEIVMFPSQKMHNQKQTLLVLSGPETEQESIPRSLHLCVKLGSFKPVRSSQAKQKIVIHKAKH